jgi:hypothetical protein
MDWFSGIQQRIADGASYLKNKVTGSVPGTAPLLNSNSVNGAVKHFGGVRERKGYTCTGSKIRKCRKTRRRRGGAGNCGKNCPDTSDASNSHKWGRSVKLGDVTQKKCEKCGCTESV